MAPSTKSEKNLRTHKGPVTMVSRRVSHAERTERRAEREEEGEDDSEEDEPVEIPLVSRHDAPEGDHSAGIISEGTSVRRESGPEQ